MQNIAKILRVWQRIKVPWGKLPLFRRHSAKMTSPSAGHFARSLGVIKEEIHLIASAWSNSKAGTFGAAVAYYTIFSIAPLLVLAIAITGLFFDSYAAQQNVISQFNSTLGRESADFISSLIDSNASQSTNIILVVAGSAVLFLGAIGVFSQLQTALDTIFHSLPDKRQRLGFWSTIRQKVLSFGLLLSVGFLLLTSLAISAIIAAFGKFLSGYVAVGEIIAQRIEIVISFILISMFMALMYKVLPSKKIAWRPALLGGLVTGVLFTVSKLLLGLYFSSSGAFTSYGGASALVLFVLWIYYMSQVFFFGAILLMLYIAPRFR